LFMIIFSFVIVVEMSSNCLKILPFSIFMGAHYHFGYCIDFEGLRLWGFTFLLIFFPGLIFYVCLLRFKIKELFFFLFFDAALYVLFALIILYKAFSLFVPFLSRIF
jgi:hypothetical protein